MPKAKMHMLSEKKILSHFPTDKDYAVSDGGGLYLFIRSYGRREWFFRFTSPLTNQRRKQTLGSYPDISLKQARTVAAIQRAALAQNLDPAYETEKKLRKQTKEHKELKLREAKTGEAVFRMWKQADLQNRKDRGDDAERAFAKDVFPIIGHKPIDEVTRQDIRDILDRPLSRKSKRMANRLLSDLKQFFGYAQDEELIQIDPTRRMFKNRVGGIEKSRERVLSIEERKLLAEKLLESDIPEIYQRAIWLMLATGCRVNEISRARWSHINLTDRILTIPADHAKNTKQHEVHLSDFSLNQINAIKSNKTSEWLFPNRSGNGPIHRQTISKQIADRQRNKKLKGRTKENQALNLLGMRWNAHDLRRTAATIMQEQGILPHIIKKCMNQNFEDKIMETYQRAKLSEMQKDAFTTLGKVLQSFASTNSN